MSPSFSCATGGDEAIGAQALSDRVRAPSASKRRSGRIANSGVNEVRAGYPKQIDSAAGHTPGLPAVQSRSGAISVA
jgi:hypothetical protein